MDFLTMMVVGGFLPAGHIEQHETAQDAAIREVKEELDIDTCSYNAKIFWCKRVFMHFVCLEYKQMPA